MRFLIVAGHQGTTGALGNGIVEETMAKTLSDKIVVKLIEQGHQAEEPNYNLYTKIEAEGVKADLRVYNYILEVHFNMGGGDGSEILVHPNQKNRTVEAAILKRMSKLINTSRGIKERPDLQNITELTRAGRLNSLLEVMFLDNKANVAAFLPNIDKFAEEIAYGILEGLGQPIKERPQQIVKVLDPAQQWAVDNKIFKDEAWQEPLTKSQMAWALYTIKRRGI